jgi:divalent metal cation (Fe/Co/Zn/Cd) transporter
MAAYLVAAIGGGVLSKAFVKEGIHSDNFHKVLKDSLILLGIAVLITIVSGFIEMGISEKLFSRNVCASNQFGLIFVGAIIVIGVLILEYFRHKHKKKHANVLPPSKDLPKE